MLKPSTKAKTHNILIQQGSPFYLELRVKDEDDDDYLDLSGYTFRSQIRKAASLTSEIIATNLCQVDPNDNTKLMISLSGTDFLRPNIVFDEIPEDFANLNPASLSKKSYYWSVRAFVGNTPINRILEGVVVVTPETTA
jgi:hypothetical protein